MTSPMRCYQALVAVTNCVVAVFSSVPMKPSIEPGSKGHTPTNL